MSSTPYWRSGASLPEFESISGEGTVAGREEEWLRLEVILPSGLTNRALIEVFALGVWNPT
jgi:hypothetical protein